MILIIGLGNPDKKYEKTRHNIGFMVIDEFHRTHNMEHGTSSKKFHAEITKGEINNKTIILAKPLTYMNNSGIAVKSLAKHYLLKTKNYKLQINNLLVIHDDIDLPLGETKISFNRGSAGHKGVQSIIDSLGRKDFYRIRIGICPEKKPEEVEKFVLKKFTEEESEIVEETIKKAVELVKTTVTQINTDKNTDKHR